MLKKLLLFLLRNIGLVGKGLKASVQAIIIQFIVLMLLKIITKTLKKKGIDLDTLQDRIVAEVMRNLEKENLEKSWKKVKNKGTVIKESLIATIKRHINISKKDEEELRDVVKDRTEEINDLLNNDELNKNIPKGGKDSDEERI